MSARTTIVTLATAIALAAAGFGLFQLGMNRGMTMAAPPSTVPAASRGAPQKPGDVDPSTGKAVLFWQDPMVPGQRFDKPGKSPFMDMQLAPVYADIGSGGVTIDPRMQQSLGIRTAEVTKGQLKPTVEAIGSVAYNERDAAVVQARANGFVERLHVRAQLDTVQQGQPLVELYVPDWVAAQEEFLAARRIAGTPAGASIGNLADAARQRMRLAGMSDEQVARVESTGRVQSRITIAAPIGGVVTELTAREGMTVMAGAPMFRINGLATVWVNAEVPEVHAPLVRPGSAVEARSAALPGRTFKGTVSALLPEVNATTRTIKARVELANPGAQLVPGMFVSVDVTPRSAREALFVPAEAVIRTGKRTVVIVTEGDGRFTSVDVQPGRDDEGRTEIRSGLAAGQKVVVSGQFLIDSEANLKASAARMGPAPGAATHHSEGKVEAVDRDEITISHGPIPSLQWDAMTMGFRTPAGAPAGIHAGQSVHFEFKQAPDGAYEIVQIAPAAGSSAAGAVK